jgi:adenylosuccinate lyase
MGHTLIAFEATLKGLNKLLNEPKFHEDLEKNWAVVAEAFKQSCVGKDILIRMKP